MAEVFAGNSMGSHGFQKPVAIKRLLPELANDEVFVERLISEAKLLVGMAHGNIVSVLDLARDGDDVFLVMEFVDGPSLRQLMKARGDRGVSIGVTTYVVQAAAAGLEFAHNRPGGAVIHADISPSNILLTTSGEVRVADFGIARREGGGAGVVEGKWAYMAPEQARGESLTPRSDVFALGVVLYELLCGEHPLGRQITAGERELEPKRIVPPRVVRSSIPPGLDAICMKALSFEPRDRYTRMQNLIDALVDERFANGYRDGANELAQLIREITPGAGPAKEHTQHTNRPVTIVTRSLISQLNMRMSSESVDLQEETPAIAPPEKGEDSSAQTRSLLFEDLPAELRDPKPPQRHSQPPQRQSQPPPQQRHSQNPLPPTPATNVVVLSPPVYALSPDMLPSPELTSIHGGTFGGTGSGVGVAASTRNYKWAGGVLGLAAVAGTIAALVTQLGGSTREPVAQSGSGVSPWGPIFALPNTEDPPPAAPPPANSAANPAANPPANPPPANPPAANPAPPVAPTVPTTNPTVAATGSDAPPAAVGSDAKIDDAKGSDRPRRNALGHVTPTGASAHKADVDAATGGPEGWLRIELDDRAPDGAYANVTINGQTKQAPGGKFTLPPNNYSARIKTSDDHFSCKLVVRPGKTSTVTIFVDDRHCDEDGE
jgi:serine/threonine protein kinase